MGKFRILLGGLLLLAACQPPSGQTPVVKPSVVSPSPIVSPSTSSSPEPIPSVTPVESPSPTPSFSSRPVEVVAGTGTKGFQDGPAKQATFNAVQGLCVHPKSGDIYILDTHKIRKLSPDGQVSSVAGSEEAGFQDGSLSESRFNAPQSCDFDDKGNLFILDRLNFRIRQISTENVVSTLLGNGQVVSKDGSPSEASLYYAENMVFTPTGKMFFSEGYKIRRLFEGTLTTLNAHQTSSANIQTFKDGAIQSLATLGPNLGLSKNAKGEVIIADTGTKSIRKLDELNYLSTLSKSELSSEWTYLRSPVNIIYSPKTDVFFISELLNIYKMDNQGHILMIASNRLAFDENKPLPFVAIGRMAVVGDFVYLTDVGSNQIKRMRIQD